jgi:hypothetical protein
MRRPKDLLKQNEMTVVKLNLNDQELILDRNEAMKLYLELEEILFKELNEWMGEWKLQNGWKAKVTGRMKDKVIGYTITPDGASRLVLWDNKGNNENSEFNLTHRRRGAEAEW